MQSKDWNNQSVSESGPVSHRRERRKIDILMGSGTRVDVIRAFLQNPDEWIGPRDLQRLTGRPYEDARRAALQLYHDLGLLDLRVTGTNESRDDRRTAIHRPFRLNKEHPWVKPLSMLFERELGALKAIEEKLSGLPGIDVAFVYGSFARSEQRPESDVDLVVLGEHTLDTLVKPVTEVERKIGREIQLFVYSPSEWREKIRDGHHFAISVMETQKVFLVGNNETLENIAG